LRKTGNNTAPMMMIPFLLHNDLALSLALFSSFFILNYYPQSKTHRLIKCATKEHHSKTVSPFVNNAIHCFYMKINELFKNYTLQRNTM